MEKKPPDSPGQNSAFTPDGSEGSARDVSREDVYSMDKAELDA